MREINYNKKVNNMLTVSLRKIDGGKESCGSSVIPIKLADQKYVVDLLKGMQTTNKVDCLKVSFKVSRYDIKEYGVYLDDIYIASELEEPLDDILTRLNKLYLIENDRDFGYIKARPDGDDDEHVKKDKQEFEVIV